MKKWNVLKRRAAVFLIACLIAGNLMELTAAASSSPLPGMSDEDYQKVMEEVRSSEDYEENTSPLYGVSFAAGENGEIIPDADVAGYMENTLVDFHVKPDYGYVMDSCYGLDVNGNYVEVYGHETTDGDIAYSAPMPAGGLTLYAEFSEAALHTVGLEYGSHIRISLNEGDYPAGSSTMFTIITDAGYVLDDIYWRSTDGEATGMIKQESATDFLLTMPNRDIIITATEKQAEEHDIALPADNDSLHNPVSISTEKAVKNETVFISHAGLQEEYYTRLSVYDGSGNNIGVTELDNGQWSFIMPDESVDIRITEWETGKEPSADMTVREAEEPDMGWIKAESLELTEEDSNTSAMTLAALYRMVKKASRVVSHKTSASVDGKGRTPSVEITKDARWTDIENGYAEITLTETDTSAWVHTPVDTMIAIDRSDSTMMELHYLWYYQTSDYWNPGESPCQNRSHVYRMYDGNYYFLMTRTWGIDANTNELVHFNYPASSNEVYYTFLATGHNPDGTPTGVILQRHDVPYMWFNYHYDIVTGNHLGMAYFKSPVVDESTGQVITGEDGNTVYRDTFYSLLYGYGCYDRHECELRAARELVEVIHNYELAQNADNSLPPCRVAVWSFSRRDDFTNTGASGGSHVRISPDDQATAPGVVNGVDFSNMGITNYVGLTEVRQDSSMNSVKVLLSQGTPGGGTDYGPSFMLAYNLIKSREGTAYEHAPVKFFFFTDSMEEDDMRATGMATQYANLMKSYDKAKVLISAIAVAIPQPTVADDTMQYLASLTSQNVVSNGRMRENLLYFTSSGNLSQDLKDSVTDIAGIALEVQAKNKVYSDAVSDYYDVVSVSTGNGTISNTGNIVTWNIPNGEKTTYTATIRIKLKDQYRYLISDTMYPTNTDNGGNYGARLNYRVVGGYYEDSAVNDQSISTKTPYLPYGTVKMAGEKYWDVEGSELPSITVNAERALEGYDNYMIVGSAATVDDKFVIERKAGTTDIPLVLYNNDEERYSYRLSEELEDYYYVVNNSLSSNDLGTSYKGKLLNRPVGADADGGVNLIKLDADNGNVIKDAVFNVFSYNGTGDVSDLANYDVYCYTHFDDVKEDFAAHGRVSTVSYNGYMENPDDYDAVTVSYNSIQDMYVNNAPLYYTPQNSGHFKIVETKTPAGYYGDWKDGVEPDENSTYLDKNSYDVVLNPTDRHQTFTIYNRAEDRTFRNTAITGNIIIHKTGEVPVGTAENENGDMEVTYETKGIPGAWYVVRAAEDIYDLQGNKLYDKGDIVTPDERKQTHYKSLAGMDLSVYKKDGSEDDTHILLTGWLDNGNMPTDTGDGTKGVQGTWVTETDYLDDDYERNDALDKIILDIEDKTLTFEDGTVITSVFVTDEEGIARVNHLSNGQYEVFELKAPTGYVRGFGYVKDKKQDGGLHHERAINASYALFETTIDKTIDYVAVYEKSVSYFNDRQITKLPPPETPMPDEKDNNPDIDIVKTVNKEIFYPGETATYRLYVTNTGDVDLYDVLVTDTMDDGRTKEIATIPFLAVGETKDFTYDYEISMDEKDGAVHKNIAAATGTSREDPENHIPEKTVTDKDDAKIKVKKGIGILKEADREIYQNGDYINYTIYVTNNSSLEYKGTDKEAQEIEDKTLYNLTVNDSISQNGIEDLRYVSTDMPERVKEAEASLSGNDAESITGTKQRSTVTIDFLRPGETCILHFSCRITDDFKGETVHNEADVTTEDGQHDEDDEDVRVKNPSINVTKVADRKEFSADDVINGVNNLAAYKVTVTNDGDCDLQDVTLHDTVMVEGIFKPEVSISQNGVPVVKDGENDDEFTGTVSGNSVLLGSLKVGESKSVVFTYELQPEDAGNELPNIVVAKGTTIPDDPEEPPVPVEDKDNEIINAGLKVGVRKYSNLGGTEKPTQGALLGLYAADDINNVYGETVITKGTLVQTRVTGEDGYALFDTAKFPIGEYYIIEITPPKGCYPSDGIIYIHGDRYQYNDNVAVIYEGGIIRDAAVRLLVYLYDDNTMNELADAELEVVDVSGNSVDVFITKNTDGAGYAVYGCDPGKTYILRENRARNGYVNEIVRDLSDKALNSSKSASGEVTFSIPQERPSVYTDVDNELYGKFDPETIPAVYRLKITNDFVEGELRLYKTGKFLDSWSFFEKAEHWFRSIYGFFTDKLGGIEFTVTANEDIYHPDGVTGLIYKKGDIVMEGVKSIRKDAVEETDDAGMAVFNQMYLGSYTVSETRGKIGLAAVKPIDFVFAYVDDKTPIVYATEGNMTVNNDFQHVIINIHKIDWQSEESLAGAEFELYAAEDIFNVAGQKITEKDAKLETGIITDENGYARAESELAPGGRYYLKEVKAPEGYIVSLDNEKIMLDSVPTNYTEENITFDVTVTNRPDDDTLIIDKSAPEYADEEESFRYDINRVENSAPVMAYDFTMHDTLPEYVALESFYTGSYVYDDYSESVSMNSVFKDSVSMNTVSGNTLAANSVTLDVYYKTNKSDWKLWKENLSSAKGSTLYVKDLKLAKDERITEFKVEFGNVPGYFHADEKDLPYYYVKVDEKLPDGTEFVNHIDLSGTIEGTKRYSEDKTVTKLKKGPEPGLKVAKSTDKETSIGSTLKYTVDTIRNDFKEPAKNFCLHDTLPENVYLTTVYTGTYSDSVSMNALYKTNLSSDWKVWKEDISSQTAVTLNTSSLKLAANEYVTEFMIDYGTVPAGFALNEADKMYYNVMVGNVPVGTELINNIELTAYVDGEKQRSTDSTTTVVRKNGPKTGDDNILFGIFLALAVITGLALAGYLAFMLYKKKTSAAAEEEGILDNRRKLFKGRVRNVPMKDLMDKK